MPKVVSSAPATSVETKLDEIVEHLRRMDKRDKIRTWGAFVKGVLSLIPLAVFIWSIWYFYEHGDELLSQIATEAAKAAAAVTEKGASNMMDQFKQFMPK